MKCVATEDQVVIDFDINASIWTPVPQTFPLLVRLFDKNGQYLTQFTTAEEFTPLIASFDARKGSTLLKPKGNRLFYGVNIRDLRDASMMEIGFIER